MYDAIHRVPTSKEQTDESMVRQCAWCLRLIDVQGERVSLLPLPKVYEATHGMCTTCGKGWMQQVADAQGVQVDVLWEEIPFSLVAQRQVFDNAQAGRNEPIGAC